jgi:hypothetical protein
MHTSSFIQARPILGARVVARRDFLKLGAVGGLVLPSVLPIPMPLSADRTVSPHSCIEIFLSGGASHIDLWDPKPDAPPEIRGEFSPIATAVPGMFISELLPRTAQVADRLTIVRSIAHRETDHAQAARAMLSGRCHPQFEAATYIELSGPILGELLHEARRLIASGQRFVRVRSGHWDTHRRNAWCLKEILAPAFDTSFAALVTDLAESGLLDSTRVIVTTEFGRSPRINQLAGRDHWSAAFSVVMAGAGIGAGQVIGSTDRYGLHVTDSPLVFKL